MLKVYQTCVLSTLLYGSKSWTTYARQETQLKTFHLHCLQHIRAYLGRTESLKQKSWTELTASACIFCCARDASGGLAMFTAWRTATSQNTYSMAVWLRDPDEQTYHSCASKRSANVTRSLLASMSLTESPSQMTVANGDMQSRME